MSPVMHEALTAGVERVAAWADVLDRINVFPVADGDTGRNLLYTLSPLRNTGIDPHECIHRLLIAARGNSGNIAAQFLSGFLTAAALPQIPAAVRLGRDRAWQAVHRPVPGTMLSVFDALHDHLHQNPIEDGDAYLTGLIDRLIQATRSTTGLLDELKSVGVVDAGALGMCLFFEGCFHRMIARGAVLRTITAEFKESLHIKAAPRNPEHSGFCVDSVVRIHHPSDPAIVEQLSQLGDSTVVLTHDDLYKVHLHTDDIDRVQKQLAAVGTIVQWENDDIGRQVEDFTGRSPVHAAHIMTDAAGSLTRGDARRMGITLLDSYINAGEVSLPETLFNPSALYSLMKAGDAVSTAQASVFERHQHYQRVMSLYDQVVYLCVGSVFTGNYRTAQQWKSENDPEGRLTIIDTTAASGRLALIVMAAAHFAPQAVDAGQLAEHVGRLIPECREYIFLDRLKYLARGGRLSKKNAWLGDMFNVKPVVTPTGDGAVRVGQVRNRDDQIEFALSRLRETVPDHGRPVIMLEYSDNQSWLQDTVQKEIQAGFPNGRIFLQPFSLTSGAHMGPGTWAVAYLPEDYEDGE